MRHNIASVSRIARFACLKHREGLSLDSWLCKLRTDTRRHQSTVPFRKQLKDEAKLRKAQGGLVNVKHLRNDSKKDWELTVGLEIHAQLNSERKLFSSASTSISDELNSQTALFDLSIPGSQPILQKAVLLPALRAAIALNCVIQHESRFDRKHYFYHDQPAGYQITQYYAPLAKDGYIVLTGADGIAADDLPAVRVGIKQIQLEQDTAKTIQQPPDGVLLDYNRVGHPLIEIITLPHIHSPQTAAACVRKLQDILESVNAVSTGMELGGLRADVNVSVCRQGSTGEWSYSGVSNLGQRTEIKNLSSVKGVEDAIIAERDRQIRVLDQGGQIEGETRGWSLGSTETKKLRGKEGEVDYRYLPDPDIPPLLLSKELIEHVRNTLPMLPDEQTTYLTSTFGITLKDAKTLVTLDHGFRLDYLTDVLDILAGLGHDSGKLGRVASNWILHELGGLLGTQGIPFEANPVSARALAEILANLQNKKINGSGAKALLNLVFSGTEHSVDELVTKHDLGSTNLEADEYITAASQLLEQFPEKAQDIRNGKIGKLQWFVGQMMHKSQGKMDATKATDVLIELLGI